MSTYKLSEVVPNFRITDMDGLPSTLDAVMGEHGLLVFVLRGTWCVFCVHQIVTTRLRYAKYQKHGINALFVVPQDDQSVQYFLDDFSSPLPFPLHPDPFRIITNLLTEHGAQLGISLLNPQRRIEWRYTGEGDDYPTFRTIMSVLDEYLARVNSSVDVAS